MKDDIKSAADRAGALLAYSEVYDARSNPIGYAMAAGRARDVSAALMAFAAPMVAALDLLTRDACARAETSDESHADEDLPARAPVQSTADRPAPFLARANAGAPLEGVKVGDAFRQKGHGGFPRTVYEACDPGETYPGMVPVMMLEGFGWVPTSYLVNEIGFERVRAVELPPVLAPPAPPSQGGHAMIDPHELLAAVRALLAVAGQWRDEQWGYASSTTVELRDRLDALAALLPPVSK